jgi:hypothetical protein
MRYHIETDGTDDRWFITHPNDPELLWTQKGYWADCDLWGDIPITFASRDQAEQYAKSIWSES